MKVNGIITKPMERESIPMSRELAMKETGKMINNTEKVLKLGLRAQAMKACTYSQRKRDLESTRGLMVLPTKVIGSITKSMAMELIYGLTDVSIMANGLPMTCKVLEYTSIKTVSDTMVNTKMTKKEGYGIYYWTDGRKYEGWWTKGKQHGLGIYIDPNKKSVKYGLWEHGKRATWFDD